MENFINEKENEEIQKIYNPNEENEEHIYEINKKLYLSNAFISLGKKGPISSFHQLNSGKLVSIKKISNAFENPLKAKNVLKQICILSYVNHPNIVKLLDIIIPEKKDYQNIYLVEEYMPSNLERLIITKCFDYTKDEKIVPWILYQILMALNYLHSCKIMHRDIKASNILIDEKCNIKICRFGNAISFDDCENTFRGETNDFISEKGNLTCQAPEILANKKKNKSSYNEKIDLWGVGCIMAELYTKNIPFFSPMKVSKTKWISQLYGIFKKFGKPSKKDIDKFASKERAKDIYKFPSFEKMEFDKLFPDVKNKNILDLLNKLLCVDPQERISIKEAINHPYFDVIKEFQDKEDFNFNINDKHFVNEYEEKIEEMEKRNAFFNEKINFYKNEILLKQQNFQNK